MTVAQFLTELLSIGPSARKCTVLFVSGWTMRTAIRQNRTGYGSKRRKDHIWSEPKHVTEWFLLA